jgi:glycosyltransferase involved in cell wall biosynthesis
MMASANATRHVPSVSVLLPVRNGERYLDATLASLAAQSFGDFEIILVDNGSRDGTAAIIADWVRADARIRPFNFDGRGLARCLNFAASHVSAPLLARIDADDLAAPERLAVQVRALAGDAGLGLVGANVELIDAAGMSIGERTLPETDAEIRAFLPKGNPFVHSATMFRRNLFERVGGYRDGLTIGEDYDLWFRLSEVARVANAGERLASYRIHAGGMSFGRPVRLALADACIAAAAVARGRGVAEPFDKGRPMLRRALELSGRTRADFHYATLKTTVAAARIALAHGAKGVARMLRRRAFRLFLGLDRKDMVAGCGRLVALYSKPDGRRKRRRAPCP